MYDFDEVEVGGRRYRNVLRSTETYMSASGPVTVEKISLRHPGESAPSVHWNCEQVTIGLWQHAVLTDVQDRLWPTACALAATGAAFPAASTFDSLNRFCVARGNVSDGDNTASDVEVYDSSFNLVKTIPVSSTRYYSAGLAADGSGNLYARWGSPSQGGIRKYDANGNWLTRIIVPSNPTVNLACDAAGRLYVPVVSNSSGHSLVRYVPTQ